MRLETSTTRRLLLSLVITALIFVIQLIGALFSGSVSLLSNAGHLFTDVGSTAVALYAAKVEGNEPTDRLSYGYGRSGIVAAFVNSMLLAAIGVALLIASVFRLLHPERVNVGTMIWVTLAALVLQIIQTRVLHTHDHQDVNRPSVYWHAVGDSLSSLGILLAALIIRWTRWPGWDAIAALVVGLVILWSSYRVSWPSLLALMEAAPDALPIENIETTLKSHSEVADVHHIHVWSLAPDIMRCPRMFASMAALFAKVSASSTSSP